MRDRTIVLWALLFLLLSIGAGVSQSLAAGNRMLGRQMAPSVVQFCRQQAPVVVGGIKEIAEYGRVKGLAVTRQYPALVREAQDMQAKTKHKITAIVKAWRHKWEAWFIRTRTAVISEKNRMLR